MSLWQVLNGDYSMPNNGRPEALRTLMRSMLQVSPHRRPDIDSVLHQLERLSSSLPSESAPLNQIRVAEPTSSNGRHSQPASTSLIGSSPRGYCNDSSVIVAVA
jgi:hypothetical protein